MFKTKFCIHLLIWIEKQVALNSLVTGLVYLAKFLVKFNYGYCKLTLETEFMGQKCETFETLIKQAQLEKETYFKLQKEQLWDTN